MNFYEENLKLFKNKIPILYETVENEKSIFDVELESVNETFNYTVTKGDKKCFIHSVFDIREEMYQMFKKVDKNVTTLIIFGLGCGYALNYIKDNFKSIQNILVIEPSLEIFKIFMKNVNVYNEVRQYANVTFIVNKNAQSTSGLLFEYIKDKVSKPVSIVYNISCRTIFNDYYEHINRTVVDCISKTTINLATNVYFKKQWTYNPIKNLKQKGILIDNLFNKFKGKSAIIVSAGPSLNKNIHLLEYAQNKALIATVGTASKILESSNIKPHFRFAMDSQEGEKTIFENLKEDNSILVYSDRVYHEVAPLFNRKIRMILDLDYITRYIYIKSNIEFKTVKSGFSIANTALDVLIKLGFKNIIFLGQDMCYTEDRLYATGSWLKKDKLDVDDGRKYIKTKDIYGNCVYTEEGFIGIKTIFENIIEYNPNINYINATEGGLGINGTKIKTFQQVLDEDLIDKYDYDAYFDDLFEKNIDNDDSDKIFNTIINLENEIDEMIKINDARIKGLKKIDRYLKKGLGINKIEQETVYLNSYEENLRQIDSYNNCIKLMMDDIYKTVLNKFKYEGEDSKKAILNSKKVLELISYELRQYLNFLKSCIKYSWYSDDK
ncbi:hypothetical protein J2Z42_002515 [Clostridium algifaecis]|uniref:6-hydroxymethylpterin diphosphokinase MptE-like domain-containing protein n=1 Tax=Clostridium algifaecis TaxID=1472040 RepID=A0ABS4KUS8_9CLOT|nr:6-hydroxymethylpterin diphosphokinase MptE-like protein [Clostridium algifaecis]MBP2033808.1 hypothetical protein [Clostridium algifaecis]